MPFIFYVDERLAGCNCAFGVGKVMAGGDAGTLEKEDRTECRPGHREEGTGAMAKKTLTVGLPEAKTAGEPALKLETRVFNLCRVMYGNLTAIARAVGISVSQVYRVRMIERVRLRFSSDYRKEASQRR